MVEFAKDLEEFNKRREFIIDPSGRLITDGFKDFLRVKYNQFYTDDFLKAMTLNPELFLGSQSDFIFLNLVYIGVHRFNLNNL